MLFASEFPIYGRFGYGPATTTATWTVHVRTTGFVPGPRGGRHGSSSRRRPRRRSRRRRTVYEAWRVRQPGEIWRRPITWHDDFGLSADVWGNRWKGFVALHRDASGTVDGYVRYHAEEKWADRQPQTKLIVDDLHGLTDAVEPALWRFRLELDWVTTIRAERRPSRSGCHGSSRTSGRHCRRRRRRRAVGEAARRPGRARGAARTSDPARSCSSSMRSGRLGRRGRPVKRRVRVALDASPDGARAVPTDRSPDLTIASGALGAAYLGGTRLSRAALSRLRRAPGRGAGGGRRAVRDARRAVVLLVLLGIAAASRADIDARTPSPSARRYHPH